MNKINDEMKVINVDRLSGMKMFEFLEIEPICKYCGVTITEENFGGIFSKPSRACCDSLTCLSAAIYDKEE